MTEKHLFGVVDEKGRLELQLYPTYEAAHLYLGWTDGAGGGPGAAARVVEVVVSVVNPADTLYPGEYVNEDGEIEQQREEFTQRFCGDPLPGRSALDRKMA